MPEFLLIEFLLTASKANSIQAHYVIAKIDQMQENCKPIDRRTLPNKFINQKNKNGPKSILEEQSIYYKSEN